jgi:hypothetical protein
LVQIAARALEEGIVMSTACQPYAKPYRQFGRVAHREGAAPLNARAAQRRASFDPNQAREEKTAGLDHPAARPKRLDVS